MEGLITKQEKPSNTEVLGELISFDKLPFITKINNTNLKGILKTKYFLLRLNNPNMSATEIHQKIYDEYLALKCSIESSKKGNRVDQIIDALKHNIDKEKQDEFSNLAQQIKN